MSTQRRQMYKCRVCGAAAEILDSGGGSLSCCGEPMKLMAENDSGPAGADHWPQAEWTAEGLLVRVGAVPHPMVEGHFIEWIEVISDGRIYRHFLQPGQEPQSVFDVPASNVIVRGYCSVHGLWKGQ